MKNIHILYIIRIPKKGMENRRRKDNKLEIEENFKQKKSLLSGGRTHICTLAGMAQWIKCRPASQRVTNSVPS